MKPVTGGRLRRHVQHVLRIAQQQALEHRAFFQQPTQLGGLDHKPGAGSLDDRALRRSFIAEHQSDMVHALAPDHADFDRAAVHHDGDDRDQRVDGKYRVCYSLAGLANGVTQAPLLNVEVRPERVANVGRQGVEQPIAEFAVRRHVTAACLVARREHMRRMSLSRSRLRGRVEASDPALCALIRALATAKSPYVWNHTFLPGTHRHSPVDYFAPRPTSISSSRIFLRSVLRLRPRSWAARS